MGAEVVEGHRVAVRAPDREARRRGPHPEPGRHGGGDPADRGELLAQAPALAPQLKRESKQRAGRRPEQQRDRRRRAVLRDRSAGARHEHKRRRHRERGVTGDLPATDWRGVKCAEAAAVGRVAACQGVDDGPRESKEEYERRSGAPDRQGLDKEGGRRRQLRDRQRYGADAGKSLADGEPEQRAPEAGKIGQLAHAGDDEDAREQQSRDEDRNVHDIPLTGSASASGPPEARGTVRCR
jgi:hypothetical protein